MTIKFRPNIIQLYYPLQYLNSSTVGNHYLRLLSIESLKNNKSDNFKLKRLFKYWCFTVYKKYRTTDIENVIARQPCVEYWHFSTKPRSVSCELKFNFWPVRVNSSSVI